MRILFLLAFCMTLALFTFFGGSAFAQATVPNTSVVSFTPLLELFLNYVVPILGTLISALVGWLLVIIKTKTGLQIDDSMRASLQTSLTNAAGLLVRKASTRIGEVSFNVGSPFMAEAIMYVQNSAKDALVHFDLTPEDIAEKLKAKVGVLTAAPPVTVVNPTPGPGVQG